MNSITRIHPIEGEERQKRGRVKRLFLSIFGSNITVTLDEVKERQVAVHHDREESLNGILYDGRCNYSLLYTPVVRIFHLPYSSLYELLEGVRYEDNICLINEGQNYFIKHMTTEIIQSLNS